MTVEPAGRPALSPLINRLERDAVAACLVMAGVAALWPAGDWRRGAAVLAGGALAAVSYRALKGLVLALGAGENRRWPALVKFFTRHAIVAGAAYVMLARVRLPPVALVAGASSFVVAAMLAAARTLAPIARSGNLR